MAKYNKGQKNEKNNHIDGGGFFHAGIGVFADWKRFQPSNRRRRFFNDCQRNHRNNNNNQQIKAEIMKKVLTEILSRIESESVYMSDVAFLQSQSGKAAIKRHFPDEARLWQWAGMRESTFNRWNNIKA